AFGKPLVPADRRADAGEARRPDAKAAVPRGEIELLLVARAVRDMGFSIDPEAAAVRIKHRQGIEKHIAGTLEEADRQHHAELAGQRPKAPQQDTVLHALRQAQMGAVLLDAEVGSRK